MEGDTVTYIPDNASGRRTMQVREEAGSYVPDLLSDPDYEPRPGTCAAAEAHARRLRRAECLIDEATLLTEVLRSAMGDASDARAMQVDAVTRIIGKKLRKARADIDRQDTRDLNLFLAYAELKARTETA